MTKRDQYWSVMDRYKLKYGKYPPKVFDFISLHYCRNSYSLISPLILCSKDGSRPEFENHRFSTKADAVKLAKQLCKQHNARLIDCSIYE